MKFSVMYPCPKCGGDSIGPVAPAKLYHCTECGHEWEDKKYWPSYAMTDCWHIPSEDELRRRREAEEYREWLSKVKIVRLRGKRDGQERRDTEADQ